MTIDNTATNVVAPTPPAPQVLTRRELMKQQRARQAGLEAEEWTEEVTPISVQSNTCKTKITFNT
jgi:hypothetical protein